MWYIQLAQYAFLALVLYIIKIMFIDKKNNLPLPPGPKGYPLVGNLGDLPPPGAPEYQHWFKFKDLYGPISSVTVLGQTIVIVHDKNMALELLDKRSKTYSARPRMVFGFEMVGWAQTMSSLPATNRHRLYRKYAHQEIGTQAAISRFNNVQEAEVARFLVQVNRASDGLIEHLKTEAGAIILKITYDYTIESQKEDPLVKVVDEALEQFSAGVAAGKWLVDVLPFLRFFPEWLPGMGFKYTARQWRNTLTNVVNVPYQYVKQQMTSKSNQDSYVSKLVEQNVAFGPEEEHAIKWSAASLYGGGADTTVATLSTFFLAMSISPEVQRKVHEEIDRVIGSSRLPTFSDRENLPYVNAVVAEALRWHPLGPMGLPHAADQDSTYDGHFIPKGSIILPAVWWFTHDPEVYHDPMMFKPERYLEPYLEPLPTDVIWGFGRRICPGRVLADSNLYLTIAQTLALFDIGKAVDTNGAEIEPELKFTSGIISHPESFKCRITPRSKAHGQMIVDLEKKYPRGEGDSQSLPAHAWQEFKP